MVTTQPLRGEPAVERDERTVPVFLSGVSFVCAGT